MRCRPRFFLIASRLHRHVGSRHGSVAIELGLVVSFFLLPMTLGCVDFFYLLTSRQEINTTMQSFDTFAWANPVIATDTQDLNDLLDQTNAGLFAPIGLLSTPGLSFGCLQNNGTTTAASGSTTNSNGETFAVCSAGIPETFVTYRLGVSVPLPVAFPGLSNPAPVTLQGTIRLY